MIPWFLWILKENIIAVIISGSQSDAVGKISSDFWQCGYRLRLILIQTQYWMMLFDTTCEDVNIKPYILMVSVVFHRCILNKNNYKCLWIIVYEIAYCKCLIFATMHDVQFIWWTNRHNHYLQWNKTANCARITLYVIWMLPSMYPVMTLHVCHHSPDVQLTTGVISGSQSLGLLEKDFAK